MGARGCRVRPNAEKENIRRSAEPERSAQRGAYQEVSARQVGPSGRKDLYH